MAETACLLPFNNFKDQLRSTWHALDVSNKEALASSAKAGASTKGHAYGCSEWVCIGYVCLIRMTVSGYSEEQRVQCHKAGRLIFEYRKDDGRA